MEQNQILQIEKNIQNKMISFSNDIINATKSEYIDKFANLLIDLLNQIKKFDTSIPVTINPKGLKAIFFNQEKQIENIILEYENISKNIDKIEKQLETLKIRILKNITVLDTIYNRTSNYVKENSSTINIEEKYFTPISSQIKVIQSNDAQLVEKIQISLIDLIPFWKKQTIIELEEIDTKDVFNIKQNNTNIIEKIEKIYQDYQDISIQRENAEKEIIKLKQEFENN